VVELEARGERLELCVGNPPGERIHGVSGGHGLHTMRERAAERGGELHAGRSDDGGWEVRASFPLPAAALQPLA
jgi:hypothetical protein